MADDTRQVAQQMLQDDKAFTGEQWQEAARPQKPPENANLMPGGTQHTAGGKVDEEVRLSDAAKTIKLEDWSNLPKKPCVRDSLLTGIGSGFAIGATRAIWRGTPICGPSRRLC